MPRKHQKWWQVRVTEELNQKALYLVEHLATPLNVSDLLRLLVEKAYTNHRKRGVVNTPKRQRVNTPINDATTDYEENKPLTPSDVLKARILKKVAAAKEPEEGDTLEENEEEFEDEPISTDPSTWREFEYPEPVEGGTTDPGEEMWDEE